MIKFETIEGNTLEEIAEKITEFTRGLGVLNKDVEVVTTVPTFTGYKAMVKYDNNEYYA